MVNHKRSRKDLEAEGGEGVHRQPVEDLCRFRNFFLLSSIKQTLREKEVEKQPLKQKGIIKYKPHLVSFDYTNFSQELFTFLTILG